MDENHTDEGHHEEDADSIIIREFSTWNKVFCLLLFIIVLIVGPTINTYALAVLLKLKKKNPDVVTMIAASVMNNMAYTIIIPMSMTGLLIPSVITETFCYVQETFTFAYVIYSLLIPAVLSIDRADLVAKHNRRFFNIKRTMMMQVILLGLTAALTLIPLFAIRTGGAVTHQHGCHLWSHRVDSFIWYMLICIGLALVITTIVMTCSYTYIFIKARRSVANIVSYKKASTVTDGSGYKETGKETATRKAELEVWSTSVTLAVGQASPSTSNCSANGSERTSPPVTKRKEKAKMHKRVAITAVTIVVLNIFLWLPWLSVNIYMTSAINGPVPTEVRVTTMAIGYLPAAVNPLVYSIMSPMINQNIKARLRTFKCI